MVTPISNRESYCNNKFIFSEIKTMKEVHSINLKIISEQMFCLAKMILKQNSLFSIQKQGKQFLLAHGSVKARKGEIPALKFVHTILFNCRMSRGF